MPTSHSSRALGLLPAVFPIVFPIALAAIVSLTGCGKTVVITRGPQITAPPTTLQPVDGIPFYVKRAYCQQQASWLEPQFTLRVKAIVDDKPQSWLGTSVVLSRSEFLTNPAIQNLSAISGEELNVKSPDGCQAFISANNAIEELRRTRTQSIDDADLQPAIIRGDVLLASNTVQVVPYVDYETVYYYNTARPLTGTSSVDVKLAADGTLTEGSSSITDQTLSTITGVLSTAITSAAPAAVGRFPPPSTLPQPCQDFKGTTLRYNISHSTNIYRHTHTFKTAEANELACVARPVKSGAVCGDTCSLEITDVPKPEANSKPAPKPDPKPSPKPPDSKPPAPKP